MNTKKIYLDDGKSFVRIFSDDKVEKVNPVEHYLNYEVMQRVTSERDHLYAIDSIRTLTVPAEFFIKRAKEALVGYFDKFEQANLHENFIELLKTSRKKDQENLLKGVTINEDQLMYLIFKSYTDFGFLYSKYRFENLPKRFEGKKLPTVYNLGSDGTIEKIGKTDLTDGELKMLIEQRKVIVSHFFENDDVWHCIFLTYGSLSGKENYKNGQPHFHYISSGFSISKEDFVKSMESGKYKSTKIHIDLLEYDN